MTTSFWFNVTIEVGTVGTAQTVTAISKANPGVVTHDGTEFTEGAYGLLEVSGMPQVNNRIVRALNASVSPSEFEMDELDSTNFSTFTSGTVRPVTWALTLSTITNVTPAGGDPEFDDTTLVHSNQRTQAVTLTSPFTVTMESLWDPSDATLTAIKTAADTNSPRAVRITFGSGARSAFYGDIGFAYLPSGTVPGKVVTLITFSSKGLVSNWTD